MLSSAVSEAPAMPALASSEPAAIEVQHVYKTFRRNINPHSTLKGRVLGWLRGHKDQLIEFDVLHDVSFTVPPGEMVAVIGRNGAGKTTLLRVLAGIVRPDKGVVRLNGRLSPVLELGGGFSGELSGRKNVFLYGALLGLSRREIQQRFDAIVDFSGIADFLESPVKHYSSGMLVRLAFAVASQIDPDILLLDEVLAVGDAEFQAKCLRRVVEFRETGKTILLVTHALSNVVDVCDRAVLIDHGRLLEDGKPREVLAAYERLTST